MAFVGGEGDAMHDFKVDESRARFIGIEDEISRMRISMRPRRSEGVAAPLVGAAQFPTGSSEHFGRESAGGEVLGEAASGEFVRADGSVAAREGAIVFTVEMVEAVHLPSLPGREIGQRLDGISDEGKKAIRERHDEPGTGAAALYPNRPPVAHLPRQGVDFDPIYDRTGG